MSNINYYNKYLKYKNKYIELHSIYLKLFDSNTSNKNKYIAMKGGDATINIILFKASWCSHCKKFLPTWSKLADAFKEIERVKFTTYDYDENPDVIKEWEIDGFPTIMIENGKDNYEMFNERDFLLLQKKINSLLE